MMNAPSPTVAVRDAASFASCRRGGISLMSSLLTVLMVAAVGIGVDLTRLWLVRSRLQTALDAAALVYAREITSSNKVADAIALYWSNFGRTGTSLDPKNKGYIAYLGAVGGDPTFQEANGDTVTINATATVGTTIAGALRVLSIPVPDLFLVGSTVSAKRATLGMELAIVLDITGSMGRTFLSDGKTLDSSTNINGMRTAATNLVNIVFGNNETTPNLFASVTTFTASVNIGKQYTNWLKAGILDQAKYGTSGWAGCVEARTGGEDQTDTPPTSSPFVPYLYKSTFGVYHNGLKPVTGDNDWLPGTITEQNEATLPDNTAVGPNLACSATAIQPLTRSKSKVMAVINNLVSTYRGGTTGNLGMQAGWWTLSPRWSGLWDTTPADISNLPNNATSLPLPYGTPNMQKVVVFMTDGAQQWYDWPGGAPGDAPSAYDGQTTDADYTAYGRLSENRLGLGSISIASAKTELDKRVQTICTKMKQAGIIIYTVTFSHGGIDAATKAIWQGCATDPSHYFDSPTNADLAASFQQIGTQLATLRLTL